MPTYKGTLHYPLSVIHCPDKYVWAALRCLFVTQVNLVGAGREAPPLRAWRFTFLQIDHNTRGAAARDSLYIFIFNAEGPLFTTQDIILCQELVVNLLILLFSEFEGF